MKNYVKGLEVVLADGRVVRTGGMAQKSSAGYHLTGLFVGSEGTLGLFTEITLGLNGIEEETVAIRAQFSSFEKAGTASISLLRSGVQLGKIEFMDGWTIGMINRYKGTDYPEKTTLFIELSGSKEKVAYETEIVRYVLMDEGCRKIDIETDSLAKARLWEARHHAAFAIRAAHPGKAMLSTDVCVPISKLPAAILKTRKIADRYGIDAAIFGHVGDGNFHTVLPFDMNSPEEVETIEKVNEEIVNYALSVGGTCTGEHGIGIGKRKFLLKEHGEGVQLMREIKNLFDPNNILNPGKVL